VIPSWRQRWKWRAASPIPQLLVVRHWHEILFAQLTQAPRSRVLEDSPGSQSLRIEDVVVLRGELVSRSSSRNQVSWIHGETAASSGARSTSIASLIFTPLSSMRLGLVHHIAAAKALDGRISLTGYPSGGRAGFPRSINPAPGSGGVSGTRYFFHLTPSFASMMISRLPLTLQVHPPSIRETIASVPC